MGGRQTKGHREVRALILNEELKRTAQAVVQAYDKLRWNELKEYDLTNVRLSFLHQDGLQKAKEILVSIECSYPALVESLAERFEAILSQKLVPVLAHGSLVVAQAGEIGGHQALRRALARFKRMVSRYREVLEQFRPPGQRVLSPRRISEQWIALNECLEAIQPVRTSVLDLIRRIKAGAESIPGDPHHLNLPLEPVWIAPFSWDWIDVPLSVFLADQIIGFCRQIAGVNTRLVQFPMPPVLRALSEKYHALFNECGLSRFEIPYEGTCPERIGRDMQKAAEAAHQALNDVLPHFTCRTEAAQIVKKDQHFDDGLPSVTSIETHAVSPQIESKKEEQPAPTIKAEAGEVGGEIVCALVKEDGAIEVPGKTVRRGSSEYWVLLILAQLQVTSGSDFPVVDRNEFLHSYGSKAIRRETAFNKLFKNVEELLGFSVLEDGRLQRKMRGLRFDIKLRETKLKDMIRKFSRRRSQDKI